ncbi:MULTISPECIES: DUF2304 domain-containing protein [Paenibacillus]|uniref:DUF2304 domain-containing protein n=1 Tax=Paenibacillus odorifer TaxID=189426 RepID=A0AAD0P3E1_9BACL|nr:DUF2304 domain-containing protein [Paenibacillus odorifer]AIQ76759.1 hypothetical protein PODO_28085 [Paenibacillus odorifer]AWV36042.1 hypothetical protein CD191_27495 [Paenibacillus odorifer]MEC0133113.1 DUF2304 domain-containing protein [Paenibacillus odorifer]MEC0223548.1 DUF2304 domain-containing protein [Paenibacillus odorifer]OMC92917.1 hypothetical protein BJP46_09420 [Paenibacillus odorifer]
MISYKLQVILLIGSVLCFVLLINMIRKYRIELKYSMLWLCIMLIVLVLSIFPSSFETIAGLMGIEIPVNALFLLSIFGVTLILFSLTIVISRSTIKVKELSQEIGLLKYEVEELKRTKNNEK